MVDINALRENPGKFKDATAAKQIDATVVDRVLQLDEQRRKLILDIDALRAQRNKIAKEGQASDEGKRLKLELKEKEPELKQVEEDFNKVLNQIPNPALGDVKVGKNDTENEVLRNWGEPRNFEFNPKDHVDLGMGLGIIDIDRATKVSGARFYYLKGDGVKLEMALLQFAMTTLSEHGFIPVIPPVLIKKEMMGAMGYLEHGGEEDMYVFDKDGLVLVGTSEQSIGPMHSGEVLNLKNGPVRYMGFSPCFRREAGSYGKDTRGIIRVHQFDKVEMFSFTSQETSEKEHELLLSIEEKFLQDLGLPYQVIKQCTGDLGAPAARKFDLEAWIPTQGKYRELTSTSTCTDFQSRSLNIKYQDDGQNKLVHTLNGTAFAMGRTIVAILENYQNEDGSVNVPEVLRNWMGKDKIIA